ncbi:MAG TPA: Hsp70 family protein, partial [Acidimicrobiales bacterium]
MTYHLGVDLGTTYTAAAVAREGRAQPAKLGGRSVAVPSVIYQGREELLFGDAAARRAVTEPARVAREFKRRVGDPTPILLGGSPVAAELLMARMLRWVVGQVTETEGAAPATLAVTHPANWGEYKLDLLRQAIRHVDLQVDHYVPEPVAAASFYAAQRDLAPGSTVAVYDLGGGTFDAAMVRAEGTSFRIVGRPDGIERLGGIDFDHAVFRHVMTSLGLDLDGELDDDDPAVVAGLQQLRQDCVEAKEALSVETDVSIPVLLPQRHTEVRLTRQELESMIRPALVE